MYFFMELNFDFYGLWGYSINSMMRYNFEGYLYYSFDVKHNKF